MNSTAKRLDPPLRAVSSPVRGAEDTYVIDPRAQVVVRRTVTPHGTVESTVPLRADAPECDAEAAFDWSWLRLSQALTTTSARGTIRIADLFAGCGQISIGAIEASRALGLAGEVAFALDTETDAATMCRKLFANASVSEEPVEKLIGGRLDAATSASERTLLTQLGAIDLLVGGPPCQGHSNLNNKTRRLDFRNPLGFRMVRLAQLAKPRHVLIENVRGIVHDRGHVFARMREALDKLGYRTAEGVVRAEDVGVAQTRRRMFLVATIGKDVDLESVLRPAPVGKHRDFAWACGDLLNVRAASRYDSAPTAELRNQKRIDYLFDHRAYDLPNHRRPPCQRGDHRYKSIYGRLRWDRPAQTITTGFRCMGQGRYVHPRRRRTITPHEAARLQFIPDFVNFGDLADTSIARLIGNAVPPKLAYRIVLELLRNG